MSSSQAPAGGRRPLSFRRRLLFALVPLAAILLFVEIGIRVVRDPLYFGSWRDLRTDLLRRNYPAARHATLGYVPLAGFASRDNHWGTMVSIDADGMRRNGAPPPPGDAVIAAVGDSFTFGDEVDDDATWPAQLERTLQQPVKNGGVFGYSFAQAVLRAEAMLDAFHVDAVVASFIPDDLSRCEYSRRYTPLPWFDFDGDGLVQRNVPLDHEAAGGDPDKAWKDLLGRSALIDGVLAHVAKRWWFVNEKQVQVPHLVGKGSEIGKRLVDRLAARCRERGAFLLLMLQPEDTRNMPPAWALDVLRHAEQNGVATLDAATRYLERRRQDPSLEQRWFRGHMTREGNGWIADEVAQALRARK